MNTLSYQPIHLPVPVQSGKISDGELPSERSPDRGSVSAEADNSSDVNDRQLSESVERAMIDGSYPMHSVAAVCVEGTVSLSGVVNSWHHKQLAQESIRRVPGVRAVINELEVVPDVLPQK